jgi:hypothetical protein
MTSTEVHLFKSWLALTLAFEQVASALQFAMIEKLAKLKFWRKVS